MHSVSTIGQRSAQRAQKNSCASHPIPSHPIPSPTRPAHKFSVRALLPAAPSPVVDTPLLTGAIAPLSAVCATFDASAAEDGVGPAPVIVVSIPSAALAAVPPAEVLLSTRELRLRPLKSPLSRLRRRFSPPSGVLRPPLPPRFSSLSRRSAAIRSSGRDWRVMPRCCSR